VLQSAAVPSNREAIGEALRFAFHKQGRDVHGLERLALHDDETRLASSN
jgi:hypothetical protein